MTARGAAVAMIILATGCGGVFADGPPTLGAATAGATAACIAVRTGSDTDGDGVLGDDEATASSELCAVDAPPRCPPGKALTGRIVIAADADWDQLADVACIDTAAVRRRELPQRPGRLQPAEQQRGLQQQLQRLRGLQHRRLDPHVVRQRRAVVL
jgi:hypothetical protein